MNILGNNDTSHGGHALLKLDPEEALHVLHPGQIVAYKGNPSGREDRFMDFAGMYRKKRWIRSKLSGPCDILLGLPPGCRLHAIPIAADSDLLFDFRHVLFFSEGVSMKSRIQSIRNAVITKDWVRMRFTGPGMLGIVTNGSMEPLELDPDTPTYVESGSLVAYPENAQLKISVYGNSLASQHMKVQWEIKGRGPVLIQTGAADPQLERGMRQDGLIRRTLREVIPFGGVFIK